MKAIFLCQNVDRRSAEEIIAGEALAKNGFEVRIYEIDANKNIDIKSVLKEYNLIIWETSEENGFKPFVVRRANGTCKQVVFSFKKNFA